MDLQIFNTQEEADAAGVAFQPKSLEDVPVSTRWGAEARWHPFLNLLYVDHLSEDGNIVWTTCVKFVEPEKVIIEGGIMSHTGQTWTGPEPHDGKEIAYMLRPTKGY
jgi:hypothetical protein